ncbi:SsgA family sporulation/cell division regulator [Amycolatopsis sp. NPDC004625]|uniref:SsgA family sporulation/cell division regulator n=1 Tax=Amycolatopsis sp. NPDC004625 TaxID=3154670 RepID=UPI0033AF17DC
MLPAPRGEQRPVCQVRTHVIVHGHQQPADLHYDPADPYAVTLVTGFTRWVFARELLAGGLIEPTGDGDVHIRPDTGGDPALIVIRLSSPDGEAELLIPRGAAERATDEFDAAVPAGTEHIDWETEFGRLAGEDA